MKHSFEVVDTASQTIHNSWKSPQQMYAKFYAMPELRSGMHATITVVISFVFSS